MPPDTDDVESARANFDAALDDLKKCAKLLRGPTIAACHESMVTEIAVSRAIGILEASGFFKPLPPVYIRFSGTIDDEE